MLNKFLKITMFCFMVTSNLGQDVKGLDLLQDDPTEGLSGRGELNQ